MSMYKHALNIFDLDVLANMMAKLGKIVGEHVKFDMFDNNVGKFGHTFTPIWYMRVVQT